MLRFIFPRRFARYATAGSGGTVVEAIARTLPLFLILALVACGADGTSGAQQHANRPGNRGAGEQRFSQPPIPVAVAPADTGSISSFYTATATLEAEKEAEILARVAGEIETIDCEEGDLVAEGQLLLRIDNDEYQLRVSQAEANAANLRDRYDRLKRMWEEKLVSAEEYQNGLNELKSAEAEEALARLNLSYTRVTAPFRGRIVQRLVDVGQNVNNGTALFRISDFDPLLARVHVPAKEFKKLKANQPVDLILDSNNSRLRGVIKLISPVIDPASGTIKLTIEIPTYPPDTRPGDFAEVRIVTERRTGALLVPKISVFTDRGEKVAFVTAGNSAERRIVETGFEDDEHIEIKSGISAGDTVIVKGQRSLKHGSPIKIMNDEMEPARDAVPDSVRTAGGRPGHGRRGSK